FGPADAKNPTLAIKNPGNHTGQLPGFGIDVDCTASDPIQEVVLEIDGVRQASLAAAPFHFTAPMLTNGLHHINVICGTTQHGLSTAQSSVIVGNACLNDACGAGFICYGSICIAGPEAMGGLGATCTTDAQCQNGASCASDGKKSACALACDIGGDT